MFFNHSTSKFASFVSISVAFFALSKVSSGELVGVDLNQSNRVMTMQGPVRGMGMVWNGLGVAKDSMEWKNLVDADGNPTSVGLTLQGDLRGYAHGRSTHDLLTDYIVSDAPYSWELSGLKPEATYRMYCFGLEVNSGPTVIESNGVELIVRSGYSAEEGGYLEIVADSEGKAKGTVKGTWAGFLLATPEAAQAALAESAAFKAAAKDVLELASPSGATKVALRISESGQPEYQVVLDGAPLVEWSPMGLLFKQANLMTGLRFVSASEPKAVEDDYTLVHGKQSKVTDKGNEQSAVFEGKDGARLEIDFRAYDDGVAFRYKVDGLKGPSELFAESTGFVLPEGGVVYGSPYDAPGSFSPAYERVIGPMSGGMSYLPVLSTGPSGALLLLESGLGAGNCAVHAGISPRKLTLSLPNAAENPADRPRGPVVECPWVSPWRLLILGKSLASIVESTLVTTLADPSKIQDESWIKPGVASWSWWSDSGSPKSTEKLLSFIQLAADMGWDYSLVDANWDRAEVPKLVEEAKKRGVKLWYWYNSGGPHNEVSEKPRDLMHEREVRRKEMAWLKESGIVGIKVDFFNSDKAERIQQYLDILEDAAEFNLMVNFHGCTLPRGWHRTWPNLLTMEAVAGGELYKFKKEPWNTQAGPHNVNLVFTRNIAGPMDYTPGILSRQAETGKLKNTAAHELALGLVFQSSLLHWCDAVNAFSAQPEKVREFLKELPVSWDETRFVAGEPEKFVVLARRKGDRWFVGGINGSDQAVEVPVAWENFGGAKTILSDDASGDAIIEIPSAPTLKLAPRGGFVAF